MPPSGGENDVGRMNTSVGSEFTLKFLCEFIQNSRRLKEKDPLKPIPLYKSGLKSLTDHNHITKISILSHAVGTDVISSSLLTSSLLKIPCYLLI